jgi:hypothetical protein
VEHLGRRPTGGEPADAGAGDDKPMSERDPQLASMLAEESAMGMPAESADSVRRARQLGSAAVPQLREELHGARALLALEGIRAADPAAYEAIPIRERATIYARALHDAQIFNAWGLPGFSLTDTARAVIALGPPAIDALRPLLDDERSAPMFGSQDSTTASAWGNRVRDYAFVLIAEILGIAYSYDESPADRDGQIGGLDLGD